MKRNRDTTTLKKSTCSCIILRPLPLQHHGALGALLLAVAGAAVGRRGEHRLPVDLVDHEDDVPRLGVRVRAAEGGRVPVEPVLLHQPARRRPYRPALPHVAVCEPASERHCLPAALAAVVRLLRAVLHPAPACARRRARLAGGLCREEEAPYLAIIPYVVFPEGELTRGQGQDVHALLDEAGEDVAAQPRPRDEVVVDELTAGGLEHVTGCQIRVRHRRSIPKL
uniref:Uncharacterized protein n=1 Tax=Triticum urartu TaxID=4572 RepID=A0A8R7PH82_TRIUA